MSFLLRLLISAVVAFGLANVLPGVHIPNFKDALLLVILLAILNAIVKPLLVLLTLPITILSFGLFLFVINVIIISIADWLMTGINIDGFWWTLIFSLLLSFISSFAFSLFDKKDRDY
ncbi:MAG: phage holin family protein [Chitinophagaceae bacterium]|nr:MAG: phage holin family protein [Chitinophagaceae bacterium]